MRTLTTVLLCLSLAGPASAATVDFEDLLLGDTFNSGDMFTSGGINITAQDFTFSSGVTFGGGFAGVGAGGLAGGAGQEMQVNNIFLDFDIGPSSALSMAFGEFGGNLNIAINGIFQNFENFADINGANFGGALVSVVNGGGNDQGSLSLSGSINSFSIGGQELWIDDVVNTSIVPLPASFAFLGTTLAVLIGLMRRRRKLPS